MENKNRKGNRDRFSVIVSANGRFSAFFYIDFKWKFDGNLVYIDSDFTSVVYV